jgi:hypothetical protein
MTTAKRIMNCCALKNLFRWVNSRKGPVLQAGIRPGLTLITNWTPMSWLRPSPSPPLESVSSRHYRDRVQKVTETLLTRKEARPRTLNTLTAFSRAQFNSHASEAMVAEVIALPALGQEDLDN